jgi:hypothetical protein
VQPPLRWAGIRARVRDGGLANTLCRIMVVVALSPGRWPSGGRVRRGVSMLGRSGVWRGAHCYEEGPSRGGRRFSRNRRANGLTQILVAVPALDAGPGGGYPVGGGHDQVGDDPCYAQPPLPQGRPGTIPPPRHGLVTLLGQTFESDRLDSQGKVR